MALGRAMQFASSVILGPKIAEQVARVSSPCRSFPRKPEVGKSEDGKPEVGGERRAEKDRFDACGRLGGVMLPMFWWGLETATPKRPERKSSSRGENGAQLEP